MKARCKDVADRIAPISGVFHSMDLGNHLTKPPVTRQSPREVAQAFSGRPATIVPAGHSLKLRDNLAHHEPHAAASQTCIGWRPPASLTVA